MMAAHLPLRHSHGGGDGHHARAVDTHMHAFRPTTSLTYDDHLHTASSTPTTTLPLPPLSSAKQAAAQPPTSFYSAFSDHQLDSTSQRWQSTYDSAPPPYPSSSSLLSRPSSSAPLQGEEGSGGSLKSSSPSFSLASTLTDGLSSQPGTALFHSPPSSASSSSPYSSLSPSPPSSAQPSSSSPMPRISAVTPPTSHSHSSFSQSHHPFLHTNPLSLTLPSSSSSSSSAFSSPSSSSSPSFDDLPTSWRPPPMFDERSDEYVDSSGDDLLKSHNPPRYSQQQRVVGDVLSPRHRTHVTSSAASVAYGYGGGALDGYGGGYGGMGIGGLGAVGSGSGGYSAHSSRGSSPSLEPLDAQLQGLSLGSAKEGLSYYGERRAEARGPQRGSEREMAGMSHSSAAYNEQQQLLQLQQLVNSQLSRFEQAGGGGAHGLHSGSTLPPVYHGGGQHSLGSLHLPPHPPSLNGVLVQVPPNSNLYVDQLPIPYSELDLRQLFSPFGHIEKLRVATDPATGEQMGYGFVMFQYAEDAQAAIASLHGRLLGMKTLHVSLAKQRNGASKRSSHPSTPISSFSPSSLLHPSLSLSTSHTPPLLPPTPNTNVYMAGIPHHYSKLELDALTSPYGHILESRVLVDKQTMTNRGIGFVRFERVEEAAAAILDLNGRIAPGGTEVMVVKLAVEKSQQGDGGRRDSLRGDSRTMTTLQAMKAQRSQTTAGDLYRGMDGGPRSVLNVDDPIISPRHGRQGSAQLSGFGRPPSPPHFHRSSSDDSSSYSLSARSSSSSSSSSPYAQHAPPSLKGVDLFVFHLPVSVTEDELQQLFALYGPVLNVAVMRDRRTGEHKGFGFVTMQHYADAENAVKYLTGYALGAKYLKVSFKTHKAATSHY